MEVLQRVLENIIYLVLRQKNTWTGNNLKENKNNIHEN